MMPEEQIINGRTEIRHLSTSHKNNLATILDTRNNWKKLLEIIPKDLTDINNNENERKYLAEVAELIEREALRTNKLPALILFEEWGTSGRQRPTIQNLYDLLMSLPLFRACDYIATEILHIERPLRPENGPSHRIDITLPEPECSSAFNRFVEGLPDPDSDGIARQLPNPSEDNKDNNGNDSYEKMNILPSTTKSATKNSAVLTPIYEEQQIDIAASSAENGFDQNSQMEKSTSNDSGPNNQEPPLLPLTLQVLETTTETSRQSSIQTDSSILPLSLSDIPAPKISDVQISLERFHLPNDMMTIGETESSMGSISNIPNLSILGPRNNE